MVRRHNCLASNCTELFCLEHKEAVLKCATPECENLVRTQLIFGGSEFLDNGYDSANRPVAGVLVDAEVCKRKPQQYVRKELSMTGTNSETRPVLNRIPLTEKETHEYYCQCCTSNMYVAGAEASVITGKVRGLASIFDRHHTDKHFVVPQEMKHTVIKGHNIEIRVIGPGMSAHLDEFENMDRQMQVAVYGEERPHLDCKLATVRLPVKKLQDLDHTGLEKKKHNSTYGSLLGLFVDGELKGRCILQLLQYQVQSKGKLPCDTLMINRIFVDESTRTLRLGLGQLMLSYCIKMARLLNHDFGNTITKITLCTKPENIAMNTVALKSGFVMHYNAESDPFGNVWDFSLNTCVEEACQNNRQTRFYQHLQPPVSVHTRRVINFAFVFNYENTLHTALHSILTPRCSEWIDYEETVACYKIYEHIESRNQYCPSDAWMVSQSIFFQSLSKDEHLTLLTHSTYGEELANMFTQIHSAQDFEKMHCYKRSADWYVLSIDSLQYLMFQTQICRVFGYSRNLSAEDIKRISFEMTTWGAPQWQRVLDMYMGNMQKLFLKAPPLLHPMTSYRGESRSATLRSPLAVHTRINMMCSSLDASVAALHAHEPLLSYKTQEVGTIHKITWPVGTRLIFALGSLADTNRMELYAHNVVLLCVAATEPPEGVCVTWERTKPSLGFPNGTVPVVYKFFDLEAGAQE